MNLLILPPCVFAHIPDDVKTITFYEHPYYFTRMNFNKKKLMLHRASMKSYYDVLVKKGYKCKYIKYDEKLNAVVKYSCFDPIDKCPLPKGTFKLESPGFLISNVQNNEYRDAKKHFKFNPFYMWHKQKLNIIPTYKSKDKENQKRMPTNIKTPPKPKIYKNRYIVEAANYINRKFNSNIGNTDDFIYPINHKDARLAMRSFIVSKFKKFGDYQDYMKKDDQYLFHSILSASINIGLITPSELINEIKKHNLVVDNSYEGFIRQLFWREYQKYCYKYLKINKQLPNNTQKITKHWYLATTGMLPVDDAIKQGINTGYLHHIYRLMVVGNYMNMCGISPKSGHKWFMEFSCDSYEWVMYQNVYDMVFYCSGGKTTWKSYSCSSKYIIRMSDYKNGEWANKWDELYRKTK